MTPITATDTLAEVTLLTSVGAVDPQSASQADATNSPSSPAGNFSIGQLVQAQVVGIASEGPLVNIGQQLFALKLSVPTSMGQVIDLQVLGTAPTLEFRLVSGSPQPSASSEVSLFAGDAARSESLPGVPTVSDELTQLGSGISVDMAQPSAASAAQALVAAPGSGNPKELGPQLATRIQQQFESQEAQSSDAPSTLQGTGAQGSEGTHPPGGLADTLPQVQPDGRANPLSSASVGETAFRTGTAPTPSDSPGEIHAAATAVMNSSTDGVGACRPNATASTLSPAVWQGQVWPGQPAEVLIEPDRKRSAFDAPTLNAWRATLKLTLPHLGQINAQIMWNTAGLRIAVDAATIDSADQLRDASSDLLDTLRSLDMRVQSLGVRNA